MIPKKDLELYLHIPFCRQKCRYCDFLSAPLAADSSTADGYVPEAYVDALLSQIVQESQFYQERRVTTIFWGGGTPSLLRVMDMERLMDAIRAMQKLRWKATRARWILKNSPDIGVPESTG